MNNLKICVTFTAFKRLDYLKQTLDALHESFKYSNIYLPILFSIDYYDDSIKNYIQKIDWTDTTISINDPSVGCNKNTKLAITMGLNDHDAIIHLEDDTVPAKDCIKFFVENINKYYNHSDIICIGGYNRTTEPMPDMINETIQTIGFTCWGCGFWRHKSQILLENWIPYMNRENNSMSWDSHLNQNVFIPNNLYQIRPVISRIQNIGSNDGTWLQDPDFHKQHHHTPYTSNNFI